MPLSSASPLYRLSLYLNILISQLGSLACLLHICVLIKHCFVRYFSCVNHVKCLMWNFWRRYKVHVQFAISRVWSLRVMDHQVLILFKYKMSSVCKVYWYEAWAHWSNMDLLARSLLWNSCFGVAMGLGLGGLSYSRRWTCDRAVRRHWSENGCNSPWWPW